MKYTDFYENICRCDEGCGCEETTNEYTGDMFSAPQPDFDTYSTYNNDPHKKKKLEELSALLEKNTPTNPDKWAKAKAVARSKFKVYPSAYANLWAAKKYKSMGGGWKRGKK
jgi:hypothetical protein